MIPWIFPIITTKLQNFQYNTKCTRAYWIIFREQSVIITSWKCSYLFFSDFSIKMCPFAVIGFLSMNNVYPWCIYIQTNRATLINNISFKIGFSLVQFLNEHLSIWNLCASVIPTPPSATIDSIFRFHPHFQSPTSAHWLIFFLAQTQKLAALQWLQGEIDCFTFYWVFFTRTQNLTHLSPFWALASQMCVLLYKCPITCAA